MADKPMRWAIGPTGAAVHVFSIPKEKTGAKCECTCPGCGAQLQAVNAKLNDFSGQSVFSEGRSGRTVSPFFRHPPGQARSSCLLKSAHYAALNLFLTQEVIDVPAPKSVQLLPGVSGNSYRGEYIGRPQRLEVRRTLWSDTQRAVIETSAGETVLVILHSAYTGAEGEDYAGVITVKCDDPEICAMTLDELLAKVALSDEHTCWVKHWSDGSLAEKALEDARAQAFENLDWLPPEMVAELGDLPLTNESLLHLVIKQIIAEAGYIVTPSVTQWLEYTLPSSPGEPRAKLVERSAKRINLDNIRLEHWMPGMVPDIYCDAEGHKLLIEVKVTHGVSSKKLELIKRQNLLCMEIDKDLFSKHGRLTRTQLKREVLDRGETKTWVNHPGIDRQIAKARRAIEQLQAQDQEAIRQEQRREDERLEALEQEEIRKKEYRDFLGGFETEELLEMFVQGIRKLQQSYFQFVEPPVDFDILKSELRRRDETTADDAFFTRKKGVISLLTRIRYIGEKGIALPDEWLAEIIGNRWQQRDPEYVPVMLAALRRYSVQATSAQVMKVEQFREYVWQSIKEGDGTYARSTVRDYLIAAIFPELAPDLAKEEGTAAYATARLKAKEFAANESSRTQQRARFEAQLEKAITLNWTKNLPSPHEYQQLCSINLRDAYLQHIHGLGQAKYQRVRSIAYGEAKMGGSIGPWFKWAIEELGGEPFETEGNVYGLTSMLKKLKLVDPF